MYITCTLHAHYVADHCGVPSLQHIPVHSRKSTTSRPCTCKVLQLLLVCTTTAEAPGILRSPVGSLFSGPRSLVSGGDPGRSLVRGRPQICQPERPSTTTCALDAIPASHPPCSALEHEAGFQSCIAFVIGDSPSSGLVDTDARASNPCRETVMKPQTEQARIPKNTKLPCLCLPML